MARHFGDEAEAAWAKQMFERVAQMTLAHRSAPFLWSDPYLTPEVARMLRDHAGAWLDELSRLSSVGILPAYDWDRRLVEGRHDYRRHLTTGN